MAGRAARGGRKTITPETGISGSFKDTEYKEQSGGYDGPPPPTGLYPMKLSSVGQHTTSDTSIVWTFDVTSGKYAGWRGWMYSDMDNAKWKTQNICVALGLIEPNEEIAMSFEEILKKAGAVRGRVRTEEYNDEFRPKLQTVIAADPNATEAPEEDDEDEEEDEDFADKKPAKATTPARRRATAKKEPEPEDDAEEGEAEDEGLDLDALEEELEELDLKELQAKAKEFGAKRADLKDKSEDDLIDWILEKAEEQNPSF